jgi:hypothetical protein
MRLWAGRPMLRVNLCHVLTLALGFLVFANLVFIFQSWKSNNMRPRRWLPCSRTSSRLRPGGLNCFRA